MSSIIKTTKKITPHIVGMPLDEAVIILSKNQLLTKIINYQEYKELPENTILKQIPEANQTIRINQPVLLVISTKTNPLIIPFIQNQPIENLLQWSNKNGIHVSIIPVTSIHPKDTCIAISPNFGSPIYKKNITAFVANKTSEYIIIPKFIGQSIPSAITMLQKYYIPYDITHTIPQDQNHTCTDKCIISQQLPRAGTITTISLIKSISFSI